MAEEKKAWLTIWTDPGRDTEYVVWLDKHKALQNVARGIYEKAKQDIQAIEWDEEDLAKLRAIIEAYAENRFENVLDFWEEWRDEKGPLDEDVEIIQISIGE